MVSEQTIAMGFAGLGVVFSIVWVILGVKGIRSLQGIREALNDRESSE